MLKEYLFPFSQINIPKSEKAIFQRQYVETKISDNAESSFDFKTVSPKTGCISWVIGSEENRIPAAMLKASTLAAFLRKPEEIQLIDISNHSVKGRTVYRAEHIANKYPAGTVQHESVKAAMDYLDRNLNQWGAVYGTMKKIAKKVTFYKYPNPKIPSENTLFVSMNPRRGVLYHLNAKMGKSNNAAIIADMECESVIDIGSRLHFHMNNESHVIDAFREILKRTQFVTEQRSVFLESTGRLINLVRSVNVLDDSKLLENQDVGIKSVVSRFAQALIAQPWADIARALQISLNDNERDLLVAKAERLDSGYSKAVEKVMGKNADTHMSVASEDYIQAVLTSYKHNQQEVISAYEQEYGNRESGINEVAFLIACAERDWSENHKSFEFVFPELGVINVAKTFVELPSDNKGQSISME